MSEKENLQVQLPKLINQGLWGHLYLQNVLCLVVAIGVAVVPMLLGGGVWWLVFSSVVWLPLGLIGFITVRGTPGPVIVRRRLGFLLRKFKKQTSYRHPVGNPRMLKAVKEGYLALPGRARNVRLLCRATGHAVLHDTALNRATVIAEVGAAGFLSADADTQDELVSAAAAMYRAFMLRGNICQVACFERTFTGSVKAAENFLGTHIKNSVDAELEASFVEMFDKVRDSVVEHRLHFLWSFNLDGMRDQIKSLGGGDDALVHVVFSEMQTIEHSVKEGGFERFRWLHPSDVRTLIRVQLDPAATSLMQVREVEGLHVGPGGETIMALDEEYSLVRTDSGWHRTFWVAEWPQYLVRPGFLDRIVSGKMPNGEVIRHTMALVSSPVPFTRALKRIQKLKDTWRSRERVRNKRGKITTEAEHEEWKQLLEQERELISGTGEVELSGFITISALSREGLEQASSIMQTHISNCGLETHIVYGQQAEALFTTCVPGSEGLG